MGILDNLAAAAANGKNHEAELPLNPLDLEEFRRQGHMVVDFLADYYLHVDKFPVRSQVAPGYLAKLLPDAAPDHPEPIEAILRDVRDYIVPGLTHWQSPNFFAYFPCNVSTAGFLGEMLSSGFNVVGFSWIASPAATELEIVVTEWLGKLLNLPPTFFFSGGGGGVIQGTTSEAILCTLTAARDKALRHIGWGGINRLVVYGSDQTHCSLQKVARIACIHPDNFRALPTSAADGFALSPETLRRAAAEDVAAGLVPIYLCATIGTTSSTAVDPLRGLCAVAAEHGMWVHVDAAYAGSACICPEFRHHIDGVEDATSFSFNVHKWFLSYLDCCCMWVKEPAALVSALSTSPEYLKNTATDSKKVVDYKDWQIAMGRRFRALKLWMVLRSHGVANLQEFLREHVKLARVFEGLVAVDPRFEVVVPRYFSTVCFRFVPPAETAAVAEEVNELNRGLLEAVNATGRAFMTHAVIGDVYVIRFSVGATLTEERHVRAAWALIQEHAEAAFARFCE